MTVESQSGSYQQERGHILDETNLFVAHLCNGEHALLPRIGLVHHGAVGLRVVLDLGEHSARACANSRRCSMHRALLETVEGERQGRHGLETNAGGNG